MKKVLILTNEYPPLGGGAANALYFTLPEFSKNSNFTIDVVTASKHKASIEKYSQNIFLHYLDIGKKGKNMHFQSVKDLIIFSWKSFFYSFRLIRQKKIDVVFCYSGIPAGFLAMLLRVFTGASYIIRLQGSDVPFCEKRWYFLDLFVFQWLSPLVWRFSQHVHANSMLLREKAKKISPRQHIDVIVNGVDTHFFSPLPLKNPYEKMIILGVGRLSEIKNFSLIIEAISRMKEKKETELHLVGDGPEKEKLIHLAKELDVTLILHGRKEKEDLMHLYQIADVFCLPSKNEGMSNALMEAMASGLPCVVSDVGGTSELVNDENGVVLKKNDSSYLQDALNTLFVNPSIRLDMGKNSRNKIQSFSWSSVVQKYKNIL